MSKKKSQTKKPSTPKGKSVREELSFKLTNQEKATRAHEAAELNNQIAELTLQMKMTNDTFKGKIKERTARRNELLTEVHTGEEMREVECVEVKNYDRNRMEYWFDGEVKKTRDMNESDRQQELEEAAIAKEEKKKSKKKAAKKTGMPKVIASEDLAKATPEKGRAFAVVQGARGEA